LLCGAGGYAWYAKQNNLPLPTLEKTEDITQDINFTPHRALYAIKLAGTRSGSQVVNISGQMLYEWQPSCDAWNTNHRFNILYEYADSPALRITSDFSTYESFNGETLNFTSQRKKDNEVFEALRGMAEIKNGKEGKATFSIPEGMSHDLPKGTLFPMSHTYEVAKHIAKGKTFFNAVIYDGSDEEGPVEVNTFIGKEANALASFEGEEMKGIDESLINTKARNVRLAFFPLNADESSSDYEMNLVFHENGVISDMMIEYDDFTVSQKLTALEKLDSTCNNNSGGNIIKTSKKR
jgi:hypothetical protein